VTDVPFAGVSAAPLQGVAFLELGERLRQRGQYAAAATVALAGLSHYPVLADAHDLLARVRADQGDDTAAIASWNAALECDPDHVGARKGLAFLAFRAHDLVAAERQLERAATQAPHDATILAALDRVRASPASEAADAVRLADPASGVVLFDMQGMRVAGGNDDSLVADAVAAEGAGLSREASRAARLLNLGVVHHLVIESTQSRMVMLPVSSDAALILHRSVATPLGRVLALGARAAQAAHDWLEEMR
jgi:predicted regulator of Ras-like GTPase activity (Roadblock/LC7/MglB family)